MKIINAGFEVYPKDSITPTQYIEKIARVCYKSEDKITDGSSQRMMKSLYKHNHHAMLEHYIFTVRLNAEHLKVIIEELNPSYLLITICKDGKYGYISGSARSLGEQYQIAVTSGKTISATYLLAIMNYIMIDKFSNTEAIFPDVSHTMADFYTYGKILADVKLVDPSTFPIDSVEYVTHNWISVKFTVDRGISHELTRHRNVSFAQESTRYCNYKDDCVFIQPCYWKNPSFEMINWEVACQMSEEMYHKFIRNGVTPQEARAVLPTSIKTEIIMTANIAQFIHIINLRALNSTGKAHPQMLEVMIPFMNYCIENRIINKDMLFKGNEE